MPKVSVIIPIVGPWKHKTLLTSLKFLRSQTFKEFEIILVEQYKCIIGNKRTNKKFYNKLKVDQYIPVVNSINYKFNQPWMLNIGAKRAKSNKLLFFDADIITQPNYLERVFLCKAPFFYAWNACEELSKAVTNRILKEQRLISDPKATIYTPRLKNHEGYAIGANKKFFLEKIGSYNENLFGWGGNDNEIGFRVRNLLGKRIHALPKRIFHLWHPKGYAKGENKNFVIASKLFPERITDRLKLTNTGQTQNPALINISDLQPKIRAFKKEKASKRRNR